jgi:MoaA/NifB/PqqE/SkfB family radical SAM enzyme
MTKYFYNIEPMIMINNICNHRCIFCSRKIEPPTSANEAKEIVKKFKHSISIEGGEPLLHKDIIQIVRGVKKEGVREVIIATNGFSLDKKERVKELVNAGVDVFNFNFPSHIKKLYEVLTQSKDYEKTILAIKNCIEIGGYKRVRITYVINALNYKYISKFSDFIKSEFGNVFYVELNMIKVLGKVKKRHYLVPKLIDIHPYIINGFKRFEKNNIHFISDGIPLCYMNGFEDRNIDAQVRVWNMNVWIAPKEKSHFKPCNDCVLKQICSGPRKDYVKIYGFSELKTIKDKNVLSDIVKKIKNMKLG